jgi:hypothetical protein
MLDKNGWRTFFIEIEQAFNQQLDTLPARCMNFEALNGYF